MIRSISGGVYSLYVVVESMLLRLTCLPVENGRVNFNLLIHEWLANMLSKMSTYLNLKIVAILKCFEILFERWKILF